MKRWARRRASAPGTSAGAFGVGQAGNELGGLLTDGGLEGAMSPSELRRMSSVLATAQRRAGSSSCDGFALGDTGQDHRPSCQDCERRDDEIGRQEIVHLAL